MSYPQLVRPGELRVYNEDLKPIGPIFPIKSGQFSWLLDQPGAGTFQIAKQGSNWSLSHIQERYFVEYHSPMLPGRPWLGFIVNPGSGSGPDATITCKEARELYHDRYTDLMFESTGKETAGQIAHMLHNAASRRWHFAVKNAAVESKGPGFYVFWQRKDIYDALDELAALTGGSWWIDKTPPGTDHWNPWRFNWDNHRGKDLYSSVVLGPEVLSEPDFTRDGTAIKTYLYMIGSDDSGTGGGDDITNRLKVEVKDVQAMELYGVLEGRTEFPQIAEPGLLQQAGNTALGLVSTPRRGFSLDIDNRRGSVGDFWLGDSVRCILGSTDIGGVGFDGAVRVSGIQLNVDSWALGLTVEVI